MSEAKEDRPKETVEQLKERIADLQEQLDIERLKNSLHNSGN